MLNNVNKAALIGAAMGAGLAFGTAQAQEFLKMSTLGPGSSPFLVMSTFATIVNERLDGTEIQVNATGAATMHALQAAKGDIDLFMSAPVVQALMARGAAMYQKVPDAPELAGKTRGLLNFPMGPYHIVVYGDSGIESLEHIRGKRVFLGPPGGAALRTASLIVEGATGMKPGEDFESVKLGWNAAAQAFQDRQIDVWFNPTNPPSPVIAQVALTNEIRLLGLDDADFASEGVKRVMAGPGRSIETIAPDAYGANQMNTEPVRSVGSTIGIGTGAHLDEDLVYQVVKAFWEGAEARRGQSPWLANITPDKAFLSMNMPLHPGALRYYREIGLDIPAELTPES